MCPAHTFTASKVLPFLVCQMKIHLFHHSIHGMLYYLDAIAADLRRRPAHRLQVIQVILPYRLSYSGNLRTE